MSTNSLLTSDILQMLVSSMTESGKTPLSEISVERFLNAVARAQLGIPTGVSTETERRS